MKNLNILSFLFILMLSSCSQPSDEAVEYVDVDGQKVPKIFPEMIKDETEVKFTDWFEDIRLIKLESTEGSLMRYVMRTYVGEEYIIVASPYEGIMIFDSEGKFIRPIAPMGKGPCELNPNDPNRNIFVDEKNNKLYVTELQMNSKNVKCFDIETQECSTIPLVYKGNELGIRDIIVLQDSLMYCTTMHFASAKSDNPIFCQTTGGEFLWEIKKTHPLGLHDGSIRLVGDKMWFNYNFAGDTIYQLDNNELIPKAILSSERERSYFVKEPGSIYIGMYPITENLFLGSWATIERVEFDERSQREREQMSDRQGFVFNIETGQAQNYGKIKNDYLGCDEGFYLQFHHNGMGVANYQAVDLITMADSVSKLPNISKELKSRLDNILETVDENDNPYLLVGKLKKSVD